VALRICVHLLNSVRRTKQLGPSKILIKLVWINQVILQIITFVPLIYATVKNKNSGVCIYLILMGLDIHLANVCIWIATCRIMRVIKDSLKGTANILHVTGNSPYAKAMLRLRALLIFESVITVVAGTVFILFGGYGLIFSPNTPMKKNPPIADTFWYLCQAAMIGFAWWYGWIYENGSMDRGGSTNNSTSGGSGIRNSQKDEPSSGLELQSLGTNPRPTNTYLPSLTEAPADDTNNNQLDDNNNNNNNNNQLDSPSINQENKTFILDETV